MRADSHKLIKYARQQGITEGTKKLEIPNPNGDGNIEKYGKEEIEDIVMETNKAKFQ